MKQVLSKSIVGMAIYGEVIFASGDGVYISTNGGDTWYQSNNGLKNTFIYSVAADQRGYVYGALARWWCVPYHQSHNKSD